MLLKSRNLSPVLSSVKMLMGNDSDPKVYHFAHLFNAVNIIKSRKILSRIGGKGLFENSAGSNVYRRETAHHYARFYYRPQTPTQYYNEALGEDSHASKTRWVFGGYDNRGKKIWDSYIECPTAKYLGAQRLGSPKCPMPVFFEFDLREILNLCIEKCYYSTGNMQSDNSQIISIIDNPNRLNTQYLYSTIEDGLDIYKSYSQQEFLVKNGLDFSCLKNFRIIQGRCPLHPAQRQEAMLLTAWLPALRGWCTVVRSGAKGIARYEAGDGIVVRMSTKEHQQPKLSSASSRSSSSGSSLRMEEEAVGGATMISAFSRSPS